MRLRRLDLNLLPALEALLSLRSVTAAAGRLHVSQPSMSGSLARLRSHFDDALLVQAGRGMELTPLGSMLLAPLREVLDKVESTIALRPTFDPATARRHFCLAASESTVQALLVEALRRARCEAPATTIEILPADPIPMAEALARCELDLAFPVESYTVADHPQALVIHDAFLCVAWSGNRRVGKSLGMAQFLNLGHAVTRYGYDRRRGVEEVALDGLGIQRRIEATCTSPGLLGPLVVGTERIAMLPARLARQQAEVLPLKLLTPPLELPPLRIVMQWHRAREHDAAVAWLRDLVLATARDIGYLTPPASRTH
ncbi:MAG TPA: LysR family transcriptional regulator [Ramlibacter sp.]|nr:LysR family transcriptional regulator [Ramlibacter sp.]